MTNKCTIFSQIITLLHVSPLLFNPQYVPGQRDSSMYIEIVYMATTLTDFMRIVAT